MLRVGALSRSLGLCMPTLSVDAQAARSDSSTVVTTVPSVGALRSSPRSSGRFPSGWRSAGGAGARCCDHARSRSTPGRPARSPWLTPTPASRLSLSPQEGDPSRSLDVMRWDQVPGRPLGNVGWPGVRGGSLSVRRSGYGTMFMLRLPREAPAAAAARASRFMHQMRPCQCCSHYARGRLPATDSASTRPPRFDATPS